MIRQTDSIPMIMGGDFNVHSHLDWTDATKDMYHHGGAVVEWTVSKEMQNAGFKDSFPRNTSRTGKKYRDYMDL